MNQHLQTILSLIEQSEHLTDKEKAALIKSAKDADKELEIANFKLDRTEKVKKTTAILLEETIEELEQKRKAVEAQNHELEIETALERVRAIAMSMGKAEDMLDVCKTISQQLELLHVKEIRNVQTAIFYKEKGTYMNYEYYAKHDKTFITHTTYNNNKKHAEFAENMQKGNEQFFELIINGDEIKEWINYQKTTNVFIDNFLQNASSLNYYWHSLGPVALGISTYQPLKEEDKVLFKRFLKVFELAYRRYLDIEHAAAQAKEAKIETALERVRAVAMAMKQSGELITVCEVMFKELVSLGFTNIRNAQIAIENDAKKSYTFYVYSDFEKITAGEAAYNSSPIVQRLYNELGKSGDGLYEREYSPAEMEEWRNWRKSLSPLLDAREETVVSLCWYMYAIGKGNIGISTFNPITKEQVEIVKRFKNVFALSYQRFDDLQKAEAQAREAQIEAALEKVRSRSLAVHKSNEFKEVIKVVFGKLQELNISMTSASINIFINDSKDTDVYICGPGENGLTISNFRLVHFDNPISNDRYEAYKNGMGFFTKTYTAEEKNVFYEYEFTFSDLKHIPADIKKMVMESERYTISLALNKNSMIVINDFEGKALDEQQADIVKRFSRVFEQAYTRFLDLQKAEAQAREAQVEAALEKVRSRSLAMHKSDELHEIVKIVLSKLNDLDIRLPDGLSTAIFTFIEGKKETNFWITGPDYAHAVSTVVPYYDHPILNDFLNARDSGVSYFSKVYGFEEKNSWWKWAYEHTDNKDLPDDVKKSLFESESYAHCSAFAEHSGIYIDTISGKVFTEKESKILVRFANVFDQAYTRFLDLQKAEAQTRESQIQLALERVRARTMAMQHSNELAEAAQLLYQQFKSLGIETINSAYMFVHEDTNTQDGWAVLPDGSLISKLLKFPLTGDSILNERYQSWKEKKLIHHAVLESEENKKHHKFLAKRVEGFISEDIFSQYPNKIHFYNANFSEGYLFIITTELLTEDEENILARFAKVFEQTYTRFLDLQRAETQTRESQIQLALERVRARTMAMQKSNELAKVSELLFKQVGDLGIKTWATGFNVWSDDNNSYEDWITSPRGGMIDPYIVDATKFSTFVELSDARKRGEQFYVQYLDGELLRQTYQELLKFGDKQQFEILPGEEFQFPTKQYLHIVFGSKASLMFITYEPVPEVHDIFKRFGKTFEQTYTRFLDLQKAEAQTREAQIEAALERVRSSSLAMHQSNQLKTVATVLFKKLTELGLTLTSAFILLFDDKTRDITCWISTTTLSETAEINIPYNDEISKNQIFNDLWKIIENGEEAFNRSYSGKEKNDYFRYTGGHNIFTQELKDFHQQAKSWITSIIGGKHAALGFDSWDEKLATPEDFQVLKRFVKVFEQAYTRFLDLQKAEAQAREAEKNLIEIKAARKKAEDTLSELQVTQKQLIQSEKMASLGELTAGIAHEIQNPLNFVNNFSEVNIDLTNDMNDENDIDEIRAIANDIKQNSEKILFHGKRADAIVKGMLQHSRQTSGIKEPTNINALCDEYLRLSYHGMHAKDKNFNADFKTDFDESIGKINIVSQDIGRVLLNLFNNAFYAVNEKKRLRAESYEPRVIVQTKKLNDTVEIKVEDNGNGIPSNIIDKIFQPFFTTKPTGQGTGLGLSLAYDIITKKHNGTIKAESKEDESSKFIIDLPL